MNHSLLRQLKLLLPFITLFVANTELQAATPPPHGIKVAITSVRPVRINSAGEKVHPLKKIDGWFEHGVQFVVSAKNLPPGAKAVASGLRLNLMSHYRRLPGAWRNEANTQLNRTSFLTGVFWTGGARRIPQHGLFAPYVTVRFADGQQTTFWGHPGKGESENFWVGETTYLHALESLRTLAPNQKLTAVPTANRKINAEYNKYFNAGHTTMTPL